MVSVGGVGGPVAGHDHGLAEPGALGLAVAPGPAGGAAAAHGLLELDVQLAPSLHVDGLVDGSRGTRSCCRRRDARAGACR